MALVRLAQGDVGGAATWIAVALADETWDCLARARLLPAQVEIALADGDIETARSATAELAEIATRYARPALAAAAACAQARVLLAEGDPAMAATTLQRGVALWQQAGAPYETRAGAPAAGGRTGAARRPPTRTGGVRRRPRGIRVTGRSTRPPTRDTAPRSDLTDG
jgi:ATP/maltotriose-dependent transcriptional regulator MalT